MNRERLVRQIEFIVQIDKLKQITRQNVLIGCPRQENDAEHSWHLAMMAVLLSEYAEAKKLDILRVVKMVLIHDLVEIDAGDTFCYDEAANLDKQEREEKAAKRLFAVLPADQEEELWQLWQEFEKMQLPEARFAACLDRLQPLLLNWRTQGHTWQKPGVTKAKVIKRNELLASVAPALWEYAGEIIDACVAAGLLKEA